MPLMSTKKSPKEQKVFGTIENWFRVKKKIFSCGSKEYAEEQKLKHTLQLYGLFD